MYFILCARVFFLHVYVCMQRVCSAGGGQKRTLHPLGLELQVVMRFHSDVRNQTQEF